MTRISFAIAVGAFLGFIGAKFLFVDSALSLIPWSIAGLTIGYSGSNRDSIINGAAYGFTLAFVFMIIGYSGTASLMSRLPFFAILGFVGGICGLVLGWIGFRIKLIVDKRKKGQGV